MSSTHVYNWKLFFKVHYYVLLGSCPKIPCCKRYSQKIFGYVTVKISRIDQLVFGIKSCWAQNDDAFNDNAFHSMMEFPNLSKKCSIHSLSFSYKDLDLKENFLLSATTDHKLSKSREHRNIVSIRYQKVCRQIFKKWVDYFQGTLPPLKKYYFFQNCSMRKSHIPFRC